ncbi:MAG: 50S ribosomal protein L6 [Nanoarchaeota archaeon]
MSTSKKTQSKLSEIVEMPSGVDCSIEAYKVIVNGPKGSLERQFAHPFINIAKENSSIKLELLGKKYTKNEKRMLKTFKAHLKNMVQGVTEGYTYKLKIVSGHFPMNVSIDSSNKVVIKNFLGEKVPRIAHLSPNTKAVLKGDEITIDGLDKEAAGQSAANIERATRITNKDRRIFQDGIYIVQKPSRKLK